jgi:diguanylate cyclase (GGDEF)-like protein
MLMLVVVVCCTYALFYQPFISAWLFSAAAFIACAAVLQSSRDMAFRDELTGLLNRRAFNEHLANLGRRYVIATLDIDHFKQFNDTHGHDVGDDVLKLVASRIARGMRGGSAYRYGGEEFCMVFPGKALAPCIETLEAIREDIAQYPLTIRNQKSRPSSAKDGQRQRRKKVAKAKQVFVTASIGVAERSGTLKQVEQVLKASDKALYRAKKKGRNCVVS